MPRSIWSGAISFGLVNIPVKLVTAVDKKSVSFHQIRREDASRIKMKRVSASTGEEVPFDEIVKGYEIAPDRYVVLDRDELKVLEAAATKTIDIEDFVDLDQIDPIFFDSPYYLVPDTLSAKPYRLLHEAMTRTGKVGIARFVLRTKQYLCAVRPLGDALAISTMVYADEVVSTDSLDLPDTSVEVNERELKMAEQLIESLTVDFEPEKYKDEYRQRVIALIQQKAEGQEIVAVPEDEKTSGDVVDLMSALEASLQAAKDNKAKSSKSKAS